ncbi:MAG: hypothetical protein IJT30_08220 [Muribaculaceae bacterium]|nr:hypothetical protein [Muribaculaceae bacterium]
MTKLLFFYLCAAILAQFFHCLVFWLQSPALTAHRLPFAGPVPYPPLSVRSEATSANRAFDYSSEILSRLADRLSAISGLQI